MLIRLSSRRQFCPLLLTRRRIGHFQKFENPIPRRRSERTATLKYDPCKDEDFTAYGIVPFFQKRLNDMLLPEDKNSGPIPNYNIKPTDDQRKLLSILKSDHSVVLKGGAQTGKSLSLITYALDAVLSRTPNYKLLRKTGLDSVIIVPTDELVDTYKKYVEDLLHGIHPRCCPDELVPNKVTKEFELTRKPLNVEFLSSKRSEIYSTDGVDGVDGSPQVLVTTFSRINDIIQGKNDSSSLTTYSLLENVKLVAVDETDIFIQTAQMGSESFVGCQGKKKKYFNKLDVMLRKLQSEHIESFRSDLVKRLNLTEGRFNETSKREERDNKGDERENKREESDSRRESGDSRRDFSNTNREFSSTNKNSPFKDSKSNFNYTEFILSHNDLSTSNIEEFVLHESTKSTINIELLKKMIRQRRKVLYKPIQFCFIYRAPPPYKEMLNIRASASASRSLTKAAKQQGEITPLKSNEALHGVYSTYLTEKRKELDSRDEDTTMNFVQKIIRFSDDQRLLREKERRLIAAGGYDPENIGTATTRGTESEFEETEGGSTSEAESKKSPTEPTEPVNVYFPYISTKGKKFDLSVGEVDVVKNYPNEIKTMELMKEHVTSSRNNVKNTEKIYLKSKLESRMVETLEKKVETLKKKVESRSLETPRLSETPVTTPDSDSHVLSTSKMPLSSKSKIPSLSRRALRVLEKLFLSIRIQHKIEGPFLVVVPGNVVPESVAKDLSSQKKFRQLVPDKFECKLREVTGSEGISERVRGISDSKSTESKSTDPKTTDPNSTNISETPISNLILTPSQLVGQNINFSNVIVLGIEPLLPQLAYGAPESSEIPSVNGTLDPYNDLTQFYLSRLQLSENSREISKPLSNSLTNSSKNIFYVFDGTSQNLNLQQDLTRFGDMIMYNKLLKGVRVKKMILDSEIRDRRLTVLEYGKR